MIVNIYCTGSLLGQLLIAGLVPRGRGAWLYSIDMLGPPIQEAFSVEDSGFCAYFQTLAPSDKRLVPLS